MTEKMLTGKGGNSMTIKEKIREYVDRIPENDAEALLKYIEENFELVLTKEDEEVFEKGYEEIEKGQYRFV